MELQQVKEILKSKGYFVNVWSDGRSIISEFPAKILGEIRYSKYSVSYRATSKNIIITGDGFSHRKICPYYAAKLMIRSDIIIRCQLLNYNNNLCKEEIQEALDSVIKYDDKNAELEKNMLLSLNEKLIGGKEGKDETAEEFAKNNNVLEGYEAFFKFTKNGLDYDTRLRKELIV